MSNCPLCENDKPKMPKAVLEVINNEPPVLFHKVIFPASLGDDKTNPPTTLNYKNVLLNFEANNHSYLYSSDGVPTFISMGELDVDEIMRQLKEHGLQISELQDGLESETQARIQGDTTLSNQLSAEESERKYEDSQLESSIAEEVQNRQEADESLQEQVDTNKQDITNLRSTTDNLQDQITGVSDNLESITTELQSDIASETLARSNADTELENKIDGISTNLNVYVEKETEFNGNDSTLDVVHTKINMSDNTTQETTDALPVASGTNAGIMNAATFNAVQTNSEDIDSILNGAVALNDLPATPTQAELTTQWKAATTKTDLVNRASIFDVTNQKLYYYYENVNMWYSVGVTGEGGGTVSVSQATNNSLGIVKGSTNQGQNFVEADGSLSVNGWDETQQNITNISNKLDETADQLEETQKDANDALADIAAIQADYVSKTKVVNQYSTATDEVNSANFINGKLNNTTLALGSSATSSGTSNIVLGDHASAQAGASVIIGKYAQTSQLEGTAETSYQSVVIGPQVKSRGYGNIVIGSTNDTPTEGTTDFCGAVGQHQVVIGNRAQGLATNSTVVGYTAKATGASATAIGRNAVASAVGAIALGANSAATKQGELNIGTTSTSSGYDNTTTRLISGVHAGINPTDAATVGQSNMVFSATATVTGGHIANINIAEAPFSPITYPYTIKFYIPSSTSSGVVGNTYADGRITVGGVNGIQMVADPISGIGQTAGYNTPLYYNHVYTLEADIISGVVRYNIANVHTKITPRHVTFATYSTTEEVIGTWADGKTIYRKVILSSGPIGRTNPYQISTGLTADVVNEVLPMSCAALTVPNSFPCTITGSSRAGLSFQVINSVIYADIAKDGAETYEDRGLRVVVYYTRK